MAFPRVSIERRGPANLRFGESAIACEAMNLSLIATAPLPVQLHLGTIVRAFVPGTWMRFG